MNGNQRRSQPAGGMQFSAVLDEDYAAGNPRRRGGGLGRVIGIVLLMHIVAVGGILAFKWIERGDGSEPASFVKWTPTSVTGEKPAATTSASSAATTRRDTPGLAERRNDGKPVIFDHPTMSGYKRYRVGSSESLAQISRAFNASVSEVEQLNGLPGGAHLYAGQWLTVPDNRADKSRDPEAIAEIPVEVTDRPKPAPVPKPAPAPEPAPERPKVLVSEPAPAPVPPKPVEVAKVLKPLPPKPKPTARRTYKVISGDTPYRIALKHGVSWQKLLEVNGLDDPRDLQAGQTIIIPPSPVGGS